MNKEQTVQSFYFWFCNRMLIPAFLWAGVLMMLAGFASIGNIIDPLDGFYFGEGMVLILGWIVFRKIAS